MKVRVFLATLLAAAISVFTLAAGKQQATPDDPNQVNREEEHQRPLTDLLDRCQKMLDMQVAVYEGTERLHKIIEGARHKKPRPEDERASRKLSDKQKAIVVLATKAIDMLEADGAAVAFPEVFRLLRDDMKRVQRCLEMCAVGVTTQAIEKDIIDTLEEMIAATKRG